MTLVDWREAREFEGLFWLPTTPERRIAGRVRIKGGTFPTLSTISPLLPEGAEKADYILGVAASGAVSLFSCNKLSGDVLWRNNEVSSQVIGCDGILIGKHSAPQTFGQRVRLRFTNLQRLAACALWTFETPLNCVDDRSDCVTIQVRTDKPLVSVIHNETLFEIKIVARVHASQGARGSELRVKPEVDVCIQFPRVFSLLEVRQICDDLELFWSVMTGTKSDLIAAAVADDTDGTAGADDRAMHPFIGTVRGDAGDVECFGDFLYDLTHGSNAGKLTEVLHTWLERRSALRLGAKLLVDTWNKNVSWESKLGIIAQALEAFHRTSEHQQTFVAPVNYEATQKGIEAQISALTTNGDLRTSLKKRVEFGNQVSLRRRTKDLMRQMPPQLRDAFGKWQERADRMVIARNAIIHRDPSSPAPSFRETVQIAGEFGLTA